MDIVLAQFIDPQGPGLETDLAAGRARLHVHLDDQDRPALPEELCRIADAVILYSAGRPLGHPPTAFPRCKIVVRAGVGYDTLDIEGWGAAGIPVCNVPDYGTSEVADHALALMLGLLRGTATYHDEIRTKGRRGWNFAAAPLVRRIRGSTFGIIGMGRIGIAAAIRARGFGMEIAFYDPYVPTGMEIALGARRVGSVEELVATSDVVSLHAPASRETRNLLNANTLAKAKPGLVIVNTARGALIDLDALYDALKSGRVAAAGIDVLPVEPLDEAHPLFQAWMAREPWLEGRLTLTPHAAFHSPEGAVDLRTKAFETALAAVERGEVRNCVNREFMMPR